jgi:exodeoxyribonuclease-1
VDLRVDVKPLLKLSISDLKVEIKKTPKFLRTIRSNKAPIILDASYGKQVEPYNTIDPIIIKERAELVKNNEKFSQNVLNAVKEIAEEKQQTATQEDITAEESIYTRFTSKKDILLFSKWHDSTWKDKLIMLDKFEDDRLVVFGKKIIYQESPSTLPETMYKKIRREIAERILSEEKEKWWTCKEFYFECDNLREKFTNEKDEKKLKFLDELNAFVEGVEKKYREA